MHEFDKDLNVPEDIGGHSKPAISTTREHFVEMLSSFEIDYWEILEQVPKDILFGSILEGVSLRDGVKRLLQGDGVREAFDWLRFTTTETRESLLAIIEEPRNDIELREAIKSYFNQLEGTVLASDVRIPTLKRRTISFCAYNVAFGVVAMEVLDRIDPKVIEKSKAHAKYVDHSLVITTPLVYLLGHEAIDELLDDSVDVLVVSRQKAFTPLGEWDTEAPQNFNTSIYLELERNLSFIQE